MQVVWEAPSAETSRQIRAVGERMLAQVEPLVRSMVAAILEATPPLAADPLLAENTRASTHANITRWITVTIARPEEPVGVDPPPEALDLARDLVRRGIERDALSTAYRQGQNVAWRTWMRRAREEGLDGDALEAVLDFGSRSLFAYVDGILDALARQMEAEREELVGGAPARWRETVMLILDGAPIHAARASARIGYDLERRHTALLLWGDPRAIELGELERAAGGLASAMGTSRPFVLPSGNSGLWAWTAGPDPDLGRLRATVEELPPGITVTAGSTLPGIGGFRDSHREARDAQRLLLRDPGGPRIVTYSEVRVVSLAMQDEARARAFVAATLGALQDADGELRETVRTYLREDSSAPRAAAVLHTHRNTILKRIARADGLLPAGLAGHGLEVRLALELERWMPAAR
ncbi:PucR family transcriptional regulator [Patulibacter defluvii]|uniref:PucR family transcriptional regulator n=1 Tax=Patulibacter defluvii TaxID=3095358 RepID=UPI002A759621|nr:helix-turn-helix domain-containing protein [Patulibacter sp. DM4]